MTASSETWWRVVLPDSETVLWQGQPESGLIPQRFKLLYILAVVLVAGLWLTSVWILEEAWDFWKLFLASIVLATVLLMDQAVRKGRVYVVTNNQAWRLHLFLKSDKLTIDPYLKFSAAKHGVRFDSHPFFVSDHLNDTNAALAALKQAQEAKR